MNPRGDVVIVGGGVIGLTAAYFLAREGVRVRVLERGRTGQEASWAGAGILPPGDDLAAPHPLDRLRAVSNRLFPLLSDELRRLTDVDNGYVRCGGLEFVSPCGEADEHEWHGGDTPAEVLECEEVARLEPALSPELGRAVHLPTLAQLRNPRHLRALRQACAATGKVDVVEDAAVDSIVARGGSVRGVKSATGVVEAETFIVSAGAWADQLLAPLGCRLHVEPVRGQIALLNPGRMLFRRVLIWGARYLVPRLDGRVLVGSTEEHVGFEKRNTVDGVGGLLDLAVRLVPGLAGAELERCWSGLRPGSPDGLPFVGRVPGLDNLLVAAGHFRSGLQLSPGTAQLLKEMILGQPLSMPAEAFAPGRGQIAVGQGRR